MKHNLRLISLLAIAGILGIFAFGCDKEDNDDLITVEIPSLTTAGVSEVTTTSAKSGGNITNDGGAPVTARGTVWGTSANPTVDSNIGITSDGSGTGTFTSNLTGLSSGTAYFVRAYATNSGGTAYGNQVQFSTGALPPTVTTAEIVDKTEDSALGGGEVTDDGGAPVTARGVVWSTSEDPTLDNNEGFTEDGEGAGEFTSELTGLDRETTYYVRAYATNSGGTGYGDQVEFTTLYGTVTDKDGNVYLVIKIGDQEWMAENLRTTKYNDETDILNITDNSAWRNNETTGAYSWYGNEESNGEIYGAIYNWLAVETGKLCPDGWRVASDDDWTELTDFMGGLEVAGGKLKEQGTAHWADPNTGATDEYGFRALPGGYRDVMDGSFKFKGSYGFWWTSTPSGLNNYYRAMGYNLISVTRHVTANMAGMSVRCIKE